MKFSSGLLFVLAAAFCMSSVLGFTARVQSAEGLNVRSGPNTQSRVVSVISNGASFDVDCSIAGEQARGIRGVSNVWYHVPSRGGYVSSVWMTGAQPVRGCNGGAGPAPAPSGADCSHGLPNPRTCAQAVAWAEAHLTNSYNSEYRGLCDHFVGLAYGRSASTFDTALIHWNTTPERFRHYDRSPPPGALVFFRSRSGMGHATISTGGGNIISTDYPNAGALGRTSISYIESNWGAPYLGWTAPYFHNA
jgi:hypothetical protein